MASKTDRRDDQDMGIGAKLTLGVVLWKFAKGLVKLGAMAGAAVLGWRMVSRMFDRQGTTDTETPAVA
ncbi:MAG TPA: hypothetical protein VLA82_11310 [Actinomycetota bacterium]|nr:hypothetical protein [Actinomycetota bacterium]